jgi:hypothetical protein
MRSKEATTLTPPTFVEQFQHARATGTLALGARRSAMPSSSRQFFTREQIRQNYERHRKGQITGAEWNQLEHNMIAAAREGRVANAVPLAKNFADGR